MYQNIETNDPMVRKGEEKALLERVDKNDKILEQLKNESNEPVENNK